MTEPPLPTPPGGDGAVAGRAIGLLLGGAAGDALGAPHKFHPPLTPAAAIEMIGGGTFGWERGEWTDDTALALVVAQSAADAASEGGDLIAEANLDRIAGKWYLWCSKAPDVGAQTRTVLEEAGHRAHVEGRRLSAAHLRRAAAQLHTATGKSAGNGSLMRTAPLALAYLHDDEALFHAVTEMSRLTHYDDLAAEACWLWSAACAHAVRTGALDVRIGLRRLEAPARARWSASIAEAETRMPDAFVENGWVLPAFQAAWSAITHSRDALPVADDEPAPERWPLTSPHRAAHAARGIELAARSGNHAGTVATITGSLLGAAYGVAALPADWRRVLHGWPGLREVELTALALAIIAPESAAPAQGPSDGTIRNHPDDDGVLLGGMGALDQLPVWVDAVISLCPISLALSGAVTLPDGQLDPANHARIWLGTHDEFALDDAARLLETFRSEHKVVLLHGEESSLRSVIERYEAPRHLISTRAGALALHNH